jgi:peptidoglycan/xylan/chitin deacetylase (PgdA/CDA1 family)
LSDRQASGERNDSTEMRAILTYHSIDPSGSAISVHQDAFEQHIAWLTSGRVAVTTVEDLIGLPATADAVAITFDDGFVNFREVAAPRLLASGLPVTLFVVGDRVGMTNAWGGHPVRGIPHLPLLDWPALARLQEMGVILGAHSLSHVDLTRLDRMAVEDEVRGSGDVIERETGVRPSTFAYPYGRLNDTVADIVAGTFRYACTTEFRTLDDVPVSVQLPRLDMYYLTRMGRLDSWGSVEFRRFVKMRHRVRQVRLMLTENRR